MGPGWVVAMAYVGPTSLEAAMQSGAYTDFDLVGVLVLSLLSGFFFQALAARLGTVTGQNLAQVCTSEYPRTVSFVLWLMAEIAIIGSDVQEILGSALALHILTGIPLWAGCIGVAFATFAFLSLHAFGLRYIEVFVCVLLLTMGMCFFVDFGLTKTDWADIAGGIFPLITDFNAHQAVLTLGTAIVPHNLFLHSALVAARTPDRRRHAAVQEASIYAALDLGAALGAVFLIHVAIMGLFADAFYSAPCSVLPDQSACLPPATALTADAPIYNFYSLAPCLMLNHSVGDDCPRCPMGRTQLYGYCQPLPLAETGSALGNTLGTAAGQAWAIALLAAGQASTLTATYAGQFIMEGFVQLRLAPWKRAAFTRVIALFPAVLVAVAAIDRQVHGAATFGAWLHVVQSLQLPLALVPLVSFTAAPRIMGRSFVAGERTRTAAAVLAAALCGLNWYGVGSAFATVVWTPLRCLATPAPLPTARRSYVALAGAAVYGCVLVYIGILAPWCRASLPPANDMCDALLPTEEA
ncbi:Metal Ion (Mn2 -iron) Transporter (Nramp) Family [Achlya hypogyna]|uniref:Metal Ion (Mn2-iron) Transporter (Nramp) Family n=1 Tax=Achlya hypogyna TaxID=1202772 RepID=A0A1V9YH15_ACHHY|nr:Metal Ion (Mn2 -iron) Transporter (Nramp) Family [Achlya hypogyna]